MRDWTGRDRAVIEPTRSRAVPLVGCVAEYLPYPLLHTSTASGKLLFHVLAAVAEFERDLIKERTKDGLAATKARGRSGGHKPRLTEAQVKTARKLRQDGYPVREIGELLGNGEPVSRQTVYRALGMTSDSDQPAA